MRINASFPIDKNGLFMSLTVRIKVAPGAAKRSWALDAAGNLKCYVQSQPEKGKANQEVIALLAAALGIPKQHIQILKGATVRNKTILIGEDLSLEELLQRLGLAVQSSI